MNGVFKTVTGGFLKGGLVNGLLSGKLGMLFQFGTGLLGGIVGGIVGLILAVPVAVIAADALSRMRAGNYLDDVTDKAEPTVRRVLG